MTTIVPLVLDDIPALQHLADGALGVGYLDCMQIDPKNCLVAHKDGVVAGFVCVEPQARTVSLKTIVVDPMLRRRGIGFALARAALRRHPDARWTSPAWIDGNRIPADTLLCSLGFRPRERISNYWFKDSLRRGYSCPACGNPCHCAAMIYVRH